MAWQRYHTVWAVIIFGWISNYMVRMCLSPLLVPIRAEFGLSYEAAGLLMSAFFYTYTLVAVPAGMLGEMIGRKRILVGGAFIWAVMALCIYFFSFNFWWLFVFRLIMGAAEGTYFMNDRPLVAAVTPPEKKALGLGVSFMGLGLGMFAGVAVAGFFSEVWGWRMVFLVLSVPSFAAALLLYLFLKEPTIPAGRGRFRTLGRLLQSGDLWLVNLGGMAIIYTLGFMGTWAPAILMEMGVKGLGQSALYAGLLGLAAPPGLFISGLLSDRLRRRGVGRKAVIIGWLFILMVLLVVMGLAITYRVGFWWMVILVFALGFLKWAANAPLFALVAEIIPSEMQGTAYGLGNCVMFVGFIAAPEVTGRLRDVTGSFAPGAYVTAGVVLLGILCFAAVRPRFRIGPELPLRPSS